VSVQLKQLYEERAKLVKQSRDLNDKALSEKRDFTAEEQGQWEALNKDITGYTGKIDRAKQLAEWEGDKREDEERNRNLPPGREDQRGNPRGDNDRDETREDDRDLALRAFCRAGAGREIPTNHREACERIGFNPTVRELNLGLGRKARRYRGNGFVPQEPDQRALSIHTGTSGAFAIRSSFANSFEEALAQYGGIRNVATVLRTSTGEEMTWPTINDTGNKGRRLGENKQVTEVKPTLGTVTFRAYDYTSDIVLLPYALIEDAAFDLMGYLGGALGERLGRIGAEEFTLGTGTGMPYGIVPASTLGKTAAAVAAITFDEILDLRHSVDPAYRVGAGYMLSDATLLLLRKLKDQQLNYLWQPSTREGEPDRIFNDPYQIAMEMAAPAASTIPIVYGQLTKHWIRDINSVRVMILKERYADYNQIGIVAFSRHDSQLMDAGTNPVKHLQMAAA
jgi:HK97 family phage major capsid protein